MSNPSDQPQERESESAQLADLYRLLVTHVEDFAIFFLDKEGRIATWDLGAQRTFGYSTEEILGKPLATLYDADARRRGVPERELQDTAKLGKASDDYWLARKDGARFWANGITVALRDEPVVRFVKIVRDMSAMKQAQDKIQQLNEQLLEKVTELEQFEQAVVGRELKMLEMKRELEHLRKR